MTTIFTDRIYLSHDTGEHPECPARLAKIFEMWHAGLPAGLTLTHTFPDVLDSDIEMIHDPEQIVRAREVSARNGGYLDGDTIMSAASFAAAKRAVAAGFAAVDSVLDGKDPRAFCAVRPPGHHATESTSMGFCIFNNIALAAKYAQTKHELGKVLIVDWDVHHGNGTQDIFYNDDSVFFFSIHRFPFYPGSGSETETGEGRGLGFTKNIPLNSGTPRQKFMDAFKGGLEVAAAKIKPELILISAGFDAHRLDPIGSLGLETEDFGELTTAVRDVAKTYCQDRVISFLEGGYNIPILAQCVKTHLDKMI